MRIPSLLFTVILALLAVDATAQDTRRATIYYYGWDVFTRTAMTIADVRARYYTKIEIANADEAVSFASKLVARKMTANAKPEFPDVRLVIDLYSADNKVTTYFATPFRLYTADGASSVEIDDAFKNKF